MQWLTYFPENLIITCIVAVFFIACFYLRKSWNDFSIKRDALHKLLADVDQADLAFYRSELRKKAEDDYPSIAKLWIEFDESLVSTQNDKLFNTLDAEHFFNARNLAQGLTSSRLLAAIPSFLTAIGVLGTFWGLAIGLSALQVDANDVETLKSGVSAMINAAATAFYTSIAGVLASLILNFIEKKTENNALNQIKELHQRIDYLYPRITAEQSLVNISDYSRDSKESLLHLDERIGDQLQKSVEGMSEALQESIAKTLRDELSPALKTMAQNASQQSTEVLEQLVASFMDGMREAGREQGAMLNKAASEVTSAVSGMAHQMDDMLTKVTDQQSQTLHRTTSITEQLSEQVQAQITNEERRQQAMEGQFTQLIDQFSNTIHSQLQSSYEQDSQRQKVFDEWLTQQNQQQNEVVGQQINRLTEASQTQQQQLQSLFTETVQQLDSQISAQNSAAAEREEKMHQQFQQQISTMAQEQQRVSSLLSEGLAKAQEQLLQLAEHNKQLLAEMSSATEASKVSSGHMKESANQLGMLSVNLRDSTDMMQQRLGDVTASLEGASEQNQKLAAHALTQSEALIDLQKSLNSATEYFSSAAAEAHTGFDRLAQHQSQFLERIDEQFTKLGESLRHQVLAIEEQAEGWLKSYSEEVNNQVHDRMSTWNDTTLSFAARMKETVESLNGVVDDLERR